MAYWWHSQVSFRTEEEAAHFIETYDKSEFDTPHTGKCKTDCGRESTADSGRQHIEVCLLPECATDHGGAGNQQEADDQNAAARVFYERLKGHTFVFALTGVEVGSWRMPDGLLEDLKPGGFLRDYHGHDTTTLLVGLVIDNEMYANASQPPHFVLFDDNHMWIPWVDEIVVPA